MGTITQTWRDLTPDQKRELADVLDTSVPTLSQIFNGHLQAGPAFARRIEQAAPWARKELLRPDIWAA